jgi:hypothetical protein
MRSFLIILIGIAMGLLFYNRVKKELKTAKMEKEVYNSKALQVKKLILKYKKPSRVEIAAYTERYKNDIEEIKALKVPLDTNANFYMLVELLSDDTDEKAPLVVQIRFKDAKSHNLITEEGLNLE